MSALVDELRSSELYPTLHREAADRIEALEEMLLICIRTGSAPLKRSMNLKGVSLYDAATALLTPKGTDQ